MSYHRERSPQGVGAIAAAARAPRSAPAPFLRPQRVGLGGRDIETTPTDQPPGGKPPTPPPKPPTPPRPPIGTGLPIMYVRGTRGDQVQRPPSGGGEPFQPPPLPGYTPPPEQPPPPLPPPATTGGTKTIGGGGGGGGGGSGGGVGPEGTAPDEVVDDPIVLPVAVPEPSGFKIPPLALVGGAAVILYLLFKD